MLCPNCLSVMICKSEIHPLPNQPGKKRMDLHCFKCLALSHMGVITEDPKEWVCHAYNFSFKVNNDTYYLSGRDYLVDPVHQPGDLNSRYTLLKSFYLDTNQPIIKMDFIPLSTGNNMHEEAWKLFERLRKLIIFS